MIVKVHTVIALDVEDESQAEEACRVLDDGLDSAIASGFPTGEVIAAEVERYTVATAEEIEEKGWSE